MIKRILTLLCGVFLLQSAVAQKKTMTQIFAEMPDSVIPLLTKNDRLDCIDFTKSKMKAEVTNLLDGRSVLEKLTDNYLLLQLTPVTTIEMILLNAMDDENFVCFITTQTEPACESTFELYDTSFNKVDNVKFLSIPKVDAFFLKSDTCNVDKLERAKKMLTDHWVSAYLNEKDSTLNFKLSLKTYSKHKRSEISPYIVEIKQKWNKELSHFQNQ